MLNPYTNFWHDKQVLITGHTGFKGSWLALWLKRLGAKVTGIALEPETLPNLFNLACVADVLEKSCICNIRNYDQVCRIIHDSKPEIIFHLAAQPLVRAGYDDPMLTFSTNIMGTAHILEALRGLSSVKAAVMITTDKVYKNMEHIYPYREDDPLGGYDPYSASKAASEIVISSYRDSFLSNQGVAVASVRAGNVIGGGDWSKDRLIPDAIRAWQQKKTLHIRRPDAVRPWQHVLEPLAGYLILAEKLWHEPSLAGAYNLGPHTHEAATVQEVIELASSQYADADRIIHNNLNSLSHTKHTNIPDISYGNGTDGPHEAGLLALEITKARNILGFSPKWNLKQTVERTIIWYCNLAKGKNASVLCEADIDDYEKESCQAYK